MLYERQCKCVVLVQTENLKHSLLTTLSPLQLHWCRKKNLSIFTTERFQAKQEQQGKLKELQLRGTGWNGNEGEKKLTNVLVV